MKTGQPPSPPRLACPESKPETKVDSKAGTLKLRDLSLQLGGRHLLGPLTLEVAPGQITTLMGPSGCGKSSLLAYVCGTLDPIFDVSGQVHLDSDSLIALPPERRRMGILFQDDLLFPHLSVAENLSFGLPAAIADRATRSQRIAGALAEAGLEGFGDRDPATLSGGQRARVALMRTLLAAPRALLLDEPFSKLDLPLRDRIRRFVFDHARDEGLATLMVTHDPADAEAAGGPIIQLDALDVTPVASDETRQVASGETRQVASGETRVADSKLSSSDDRPDICHSGPRGRRRLVAKPS